jgi:primary-amine oxidase
LDRIGTHRAVEPLRDAAGAATLVGRTDRSAMSHDPQTATPTKSEPPVPVGAPVLHPLDPLTAEELHRASAAVRDAHPELGSVAFSQITVRDPEKAFVVGWTGTGAIPRRAKAVVFDRSTSSTYEAIVDLGSVEAGDPAPEDGSAEVVAWQHVPGAYPAVNFDDMQEVGKVALADERVKAALARRGFDDLTYVKLFAPPSGDYPPDRAGRNFGWGTCYLQEDPWDNLFARPIEGLRVLVDLDALEVVEVEDGPIIPVSEERGRYHHPEDVGGWRDDIAPLDIVQRDGPGFTVDGNEIAWQDWKLHVAIHPFEGLVLSHLRFRDGEEERQVLYRGALAEMIVPYGDTDPNYYWRTYFDAGEYGVGRLSNSLTLGCDCLGEIRYVDAIVTKADGSPRRIPNAICIHEEDASILAKHTDEEQGQYVRRARRLVISQIATIGNYDYGFYWSLYQDGTIEVEIKLTGVVLTRGIIPGERQRHANLIAPDLGAPHHQHLFCVRLDMAVDGFANTVEERDLVLVEDGPENPYGHATEIRSTVIRSEAEGRRAIDPMASRHWTVVNRGRANKVGEPTGYALMPHNGPGLLAHPRSSLAKRAAFATSPLWVTAYDQDETHAAGDYPNQHPGGAGLPAFVAGDRPLEDADVVLWHTLGVSHGVRPEDWPIMPVEKVGFALRPFGFFDRSPSQRVPPSAAVHAHGHANGHHAHHDHGGRDGGAACH